MMSHVYSWGYAGLNFVTWVDIFPFEDDFFVSLSNMPDVHSNLSFYHKIPHICDSTFL